MISAVLLVAWGLHRSAADKIHEVGRLPSWNAYHCEINQELILESARLMKSHGLLDVGYDHVNIDDCYSEKKRSPTGDIVANQQRFSSGMNWLTDQIHDLGLYYSDSGWYTCQMYPGSYMNEERDIKLFQDWGFDLLKYDNCAVPYDDIIKEGMIGKFTRMSNAIKKLSRDSGRPPILFSLCQWGRLQPWIWARRLGQSWRTTMDIDPNWNSLMSILNENSFFAWASNFYGHNDLDIRSLIHQLSGNGDLTYEESKAHFTAWAFMKSPLLIKAQLSKVTEDTLRILKNTEIIAINQDPIVGTAITPFRWGVNPDWTHNRTHPAQYWSGETHKGVVFMLLNTLDHPADMFFSFTESPWIRAGHQYAVRDLWSHTDNGTHVRNFTAHAVPSHGVAALLLTDAGYEPKGTMPPCARIEWCMGQDGTKADPNINWIGS
ncbi:glycoside hydrolase family 27 protein [Crassisporium funariophilum]|nr:glycoside hydrolase family 27 protein [Crassisporium funariophilum]